MQYPLTGHSSSWRQGATMKNLEFCPETETLTCTACMRKCRSAQSDMELICIQTLVKKSFPIPLVRDGEGNHVILVCPPCSPAEDIPPSPLLFTSPLLPRLTHSRNGIGKAYFFTRTKIPVFCVVSPG
jgi:hypothetical protein